jgi:signal transduction histidine kinase
MPLIKKKNTINPDFGLLLSDFNRSLTLMVDRSLLIHNFTVKIKQISSAGCVYVFLLDRLTGKYKLQNAAGHKTEQLLDGKGRLIHWLSVNETGLRLSKQADVVDYFSTEERRILKHLDAEWIYPLKVINHISGMIVLSRKDDGRTFSAQETGPLSLLFDQAAIAIEYVSLQEMQTDRIRKMYRTDRLATLGELAAGAAHEIRNPLTSIRSTIQYLSKDFAADPVKSEMVATLIREVERINKIVQGLLSFARPSALNTSEVNVEQLINRTLLLIHTTLQEQKVEIQFEYFTDGSVLFGDAEQLQQLFLNLLLNAIEAMSDNAPECPRILIISLEEGVMLDERTRYLLISFEDTGKGIEEKDLENIFNPFFSTRKDGTGLGLAISYGIVNRHGGDIELKSTPGKGTVFTIKLPQRIS